MVMVMVMVMMTVSPVISYSMGAPDAACSAMTPGHQHQPQEGPVPANLTLSSDFVRPGDMLGVELKTRESQQFKGFIIQARSAKDKGNQVGSFVVSGDQASYMTCGRGIHNSITHRKSNLKESIQAQWRAPYDFDGEVVFRFTYLREYNTYWVAVETSPVRVGRSLPEEQEERTIQEPSVKSQDRKSPNDILKEDRDTELSVDDKEEIEEAEKPVEEDVIKPISVADYSVDPVESYTPVYISSTTTLSTTTTTTEMPREPLPVINGVQQYTDPYDPIYDGCSTAANSSKACFGMPQGCEKTKKCRLILSYRPEKLSYVFEMKGLSNGYIAMGLSRDDSMGEDLTTSCLISGNGQVDIVTGLNKGYSGNKNVARGPNKEQRDGIEERSRSSIRDGWISCSWRRRSRTKIEGEAWVLDRDKFHIMLAQGTVTEGSLNKHRAKIISGTKLGLGEVGLVQAKSQIYILLHGSFMIGAWVCAASLGIIIARYYKQTWTANRCCNLDQWFIWHRTFMMLTWSLTMVAFVLILMELEGLSTTYNTNPHTLLGFITVGLCFLQPFLALIRCSPTHRYRGFFNWIHWFIGNSAQILGIVCIFYAVDLDKARLPRPETDWLLIAFVGFHFLSHLLLSALSCVGENSNSKSGYPLAMRPLTRNGGSYPDYEELKRDQPGSSVRTFVLCVYTLINMIVTAALILLVVMAPTRQKLVDFGILPQ